MHVPQEMRVYRAERNMSQAQLAAKIGVTRMTVYNWEKGKTTPPADWRARAEGTWTDKTEVTARNAPQCFKREKITNRLSTWHPTLAHPKWYLGASCPLRSVAEAAGHTMPATMGELAGYTAPSVADVVAICRANGVADDATAAWLAAIGEQFPT